VSAAWDARLLLHVVNGVTDKVMHALCERLPALTHLTGYQIGILLDGV
jgi:hypothetical protein